MLNLLLLAAAIAVPVIGYGFAKYFNGIVGGVDKFMGVDQ